MDAEAGQLWNFLDPMGRNWSRISYRPGDAELHYARWQFWRGSLTENHIAVAERLARAGNNRTCIRNLYGLKGSWELEKSAWPLAAANFAEALRMARESGIADVASETGLALAKYRLGQLSEPQREAERLSQKRSCSHRLLAQLWRAAGNTEEATRSALAAYRWAWADGEPYVHRYELSKVIELLQEMSVAIPTLQLYGRESDEELPWGANVQSVIEELRVTKKSGANKGEEMGVPFDS